MPAPDQGAERYRALEQDPRLLTRSGADIFANRNGYDISVSAFLTDVAHCADQLPDARYCINLCTDRYRFTTAFFAAALRGQTTLLPSQRSSQALNDLRSKYSRCAVLADDPETLCDALIDLAPSVNHTASELRTPQIDPAQLIAIAFTSGSTGAPEAHPKTWAQLTAGRATHARYLHAARNHNATTTNPPATNTERHTQTLGLVATVPSWHMYGLEWAMLLPTVAPYTLHCGPDFFPGDVRDAVARFAQPTVLVSTPVHLRALLKAPVPENEVRAIVCATAPLDQTLVKATEQHLSSTMFEIYGCSEIGSLAWRQPALEPGWEFFDNLNLQFADPITADDTADLLSVSTSHMTEAITLADRFGQLPNKKYELLGRSTDLVKIAGKRESLANLNSVLLALPGVDDGVIYLPSALTEQLTTSQDGEERLAAFVVGTNLNLTDLRQALAAQLDPAFVPRPIRLVNALPRDTTSKLKLSALAELALSYADV